MGLQSQSRTTQGKSSKIWGPRYSISISPVENKVWKHKNAPFLKLRPTVFSLSFPQSASNNYQSVTFLPKLTLGILLVESSENNNGRALIEVNRDMFHWLIPPFLSKKQDLSRKSLQENIWFAG